MNYSMKPPDDKIDGHFPEIIIELDSTFTALPPLRPRRKIVVDEMQTRSRVVRQLGINRWAIIGSSDNPNLMIPCHLPADVPSDARLEALMRLTGVCGDQYFQTPHCLRSQTQRRHV